MPSDYDKIRSDNIEEYGKGKRHLAFLGRLYTDRTHFVFELLQNAEDAGASRILFKLFEDRLEVTHDGRPFDESDVRGVCGVDEGTKAKDLTQIGKFGIGFKSVYAYTTKPEIHSGDENFKIENYVRPYIVKPRSIGDPWTTLFVFAFDAPSIDPEMASKEIGTCLSNLNARTMLFLRNIREIDYELSDTKGVYLREEADRGFARQVEVLGQNSEQAVNEDWLIFERRVTLPDDSGQAPVEIGFRIETNPKDKKKSIVRTEGSPLIVYFPTEKDTRLGFLMHGPCRTTPSRDNIPGHDDWNNKLIEETAELLVESLQKLKEMGLLSVSLLRALPIRMDDFLGTTLFSPIFKRVRRALRNEELLPADDGTFVAARNAKIARGVGLTQILNKVQLSELFQSNNEIKWLSTDITQDRTPDLRSYLTSELEVGEVDPDVFARQISRRFLARRDDVWFIRFYEFLSEQKALWRPPRWEYDSGGILRRKPILPLQDGTYVNPFRDDGSPKAYLAVKADIDTSFPIVKLTLSENEGARHFLSQLGIPELDLVAEVIEKILPKYLDDRFTVSIEENRRDLKKIERAYETDSQEKKGRLRKQLLEVPFILAESPHSEKTVFLRPFQVYFGSEELHMFFSGNDSFACVNLSHPQSELFRYLGVSENVRIKRREGSLDKHVTIRDQHSWHERGLNGFDPNIRIDGLRFAMDTPSPQKSAFIWNKITIPNSDCIRGVVEKSSRQTYEGSRRENEVSVFGKLLINTAWLPGPDGNMYKPSELNLDDLPESFVRDEKLADCLEMKKDTVVQLAEESGISEESLEVARQIDEAPPEVRKEIASLLQKRQENQAEFPQRSTTNPERRQERVKEHMENASDKEYETRQRNVRTSRGSIDPGTWLSNLYTNDSDQMICQICKDEMPFKKRDGDYYFEAVEALSRDYFPREHEIQFLALCPLCAAMYQEFVKYDEEQEAKLYHALQNAEGLEVPVKLGERETSVRFVERHWLDLKIVLNEYQE